MSYRRNDAEGEAGRLFDDLVREFGKESVFMDVSTIQPGLDFRKVIDQNVATCGVLLAIIGVNWIDAKNEAGERRLEDPADFVRLETASALKRDIPVIPVLVRSARMPGLQALPEDLKELAYRNAVEITFARWNYDVQRLIDALRPFVASRSFRQRVLMLPASWWQRAECFRIHLGPLLRMVKRCNERRPSGSEDSIIRLQASTVVDAVRMEAVQGMVPVEASGLAAPHSFLREYGSSRRG
jgi:TIR domain